MAGSIIAPVAGSLISGAIGGFGSNKAEGQFRGGANAAQQLIAPTPFQSFSNFFSVNPQGQANHTATGARQNQFLLENSNAALGRLRGFNRDEFRDRLLEASNRVNDKREGQAFSSLESKLFNRQGASTGTQRQIADFGADLEDRRFNRAVQSEFSADQFGRGRFNDFQNAFGMLTGFDDRRQAIQRASLEGGRLGLPMAVNNPAMAQAGAFQAQNTQDFFDGLGGAVGGAAQVGINAFQNRGGGSSGGGGFFNPGAINFGSNPFTSLGFG